MKARLLLIAAAIGITSSLVGCAKTDSTATTTTTETATTEEFDGSLSSALSVKLGCGENNDPCL